MVFILIGVYFLSLSKVCRILHYDLSFPALKFSRKILGSLYFRSRFKCGSAVD